MVQTLREQELGLKRLWAGYRDKNWILSTLQTICHQVDETGSAVMRRASSNRSTSVLLQLVSILNTLFKSWVGSWQSSLKRLNCWRKAVQSLILLFVNIQCANYMLTWKV